MMTDTLAPSLVATRPAVALPSVEMACWQGYFAAEGLLGASDGMFGASPAAGLGMQGVAVGHGAATTLRTVEFAALPFVVSIKAAATVEAVAGDQMVVAAPKQADKRDKSTQPDTTTAVTRNDVEPPGSRPGAPPA